MTANCEVALLAPRDFPGILSLQEPNLHEIVCDCSQSIQADLAGNLVPRAASEAPTGGRSCNFANVIPTTQQAVASIAQTWPSMGVGAAVMIEAPHLRKHALRLMGSQRVSRTVARRSFSPSTPEAR